MKTSTHFRALVFGFALLFAGSASAAEVRVMISGGLTAAYKELVPEFERLTGHKVLTAYGDVTSSMLQDIRRGRRTEIEFINGYVVNMARQFGLDAPINAAIVETVHAITSGRLAPHPGLLAQVLQARTHK